MLKKMKEKYLNVTTALVERPMTMQNASPCSVFEYGEHSVKLLNLEPEICNKPSASLLPPPKPLLIGAPCEKGEYPLVILLHGYLLNNYFYSQLIQHVASHGFIVIAPQLYRVAGPDSEEEIKSVAAVTDWLIDGLNPALPQDVTPNLNKLALGGHSRGGKVAFAIALGHAKTRLKISALIGIDTVDGMDRGKQTNPPILTYVPRSLDLKMATLVIGSGLGGMKRNPLFPPCAPKGVSHDDFFDECCPPAWHLVAKEFGHLDMLDDETKGVRGKATYCLCKNGRARKPMREFVGGVMVAFMRGYLDGEMKDLLALKERPDSAPLEISVATSLS